MTAKSFRSVFFVALAFASIVSAASCGSSEPDQAASANSTDQAGDQQQTQTPAERADEDEDDSGARVITVTVKNGKIETQEDLVEVAVGEPILIEVNADTADEVHVHGYERRVEVKRAKTAVIEFNADIPGTFEVELEEAGLELFELRVQ